MPETEKQQLIRTATLIRRFLETQWPGWHHKRGRPVQEPLSRGTCQTSSLFVAEILRRNGIQAKVVQGNSLHQNEGYYWKGRWHGHAWVETLGYIIDVTADQFDRHAVSVIETGSENYKAGSDTATPGARELRGEFVRNALLNWPEIFEDT